MRLYVAAPDPWLSLQCSEHSSHGRERPAKRDHALRNRKLNWGVSALQFLMRLHRPCDRVHPPCPNTLVDAVEIKLVMKADSEAVGTFLCRMCRTIFPTIISCLSNSPDPIIPCFEKRCSDRKLSSSLDFATVLLVPLYACPRIFAQGTYSRDDSHHVIIASASRSSSPKIQDLVATMQTAHEILQHGQSPHKPQTKDAESVPSTEIAFGVETEFLIRPRIFNERIGPPEFLNPRNSSLVWHSRQ